ncbi:hypothetical protein L6164_034367 [Bauhinia variegata]|uniref:Uncharacterized protein n=1 Tax=Bauhinia variegata TaxID=167791 RepID=A0ACB9KVC9_BAUVA|nr:hypothetical protein L6164_034367 [Bauhinia variegata]
MRVTEKCDVYSFGVVALEIMMGKHPGDLLASLSSSLMMDLQMLLKDEIDQRLRPPSGELAKAVALVVTIALACTRNAPDSRPTMRYVAQELSANKLACFSEPFGMLTLTKLAGFQK